MTDMRIVVAGHVDHGKSTLIGRLLYETGSLPQQTADRLDRAGGLRQAAAFAFVTDQLAEEQEGSFTLDTTQARLHRGKRDYTLIDTPGHREFLKNMVTGTTRADAAILVVDADEGPLPQTYLHAYLIAMLGIRRMIVAVNKMDLLAYDRNRFDALSRQLSAYLGRIGITPAAILPISAQQGDHLVESSIRMPWNRTQPLLEALDELVRPENDVSRALRFVVQCLFPENGHRVVLGRIASGTLRQGQTIVFGPGDHKSVVTSVRLGHDETRAATAGQCVAILLQDIGPVQRGSVGFEAGSPPRINDRFTARAFWISPRPLAQGDEVQILCGTQSRSGHVETIGSVIDPVTLEAVGTRTCQVEDSQVAQITLRVDSPLCADRFDVVPELGRFAVLRDGRIVGGGMIIR